MTLLHIQAAYFVVLISFTKGLGIVNLSMDISGAATLGQTVNFVCSVAVSHQGNPVIWSQRRGQIEVEIANNNIASIQHGGRYSFSQSANPVTNRLIYTMSITRAMYEDSGEISCKLASSVAPPQYRTLAVCDDPSKDYCNCALKEGWMNPLCFERPSSIRQLQMNYGRATTGLGVCLGIAVVYGIVVSIILAGDCMKKLNLRRQKSAALAEARKNFRRSPYDQADSLNNDPVDGNSQASSEAPITTSSTDSGIGVNAYDNRMYRDDEDNYHEIAAAGNASGEEKGRELRHERRARAREALGQTARPALLSPAGRSQGTPDTRLGPGEARTQNSRMPMSRAMQDTPRSPDGRMVPENEVGGVPVLLPKHNGYITHSNGYPEGQLEAHNNSYGEYNGNPSRGGAKPRTKGPNMLNEYHAPYTENNSVATPWSTKSSQVPSNTFNTTTAATPYPERPPPGRDLQRDTGNPRIFEFVENKSPYRNNADYNENFNAAVVDQGNTVV